MSTYRIHVATGEGEVVIGLKVRQGASITIESESSS
jgi:hypothetical protein